MRSRDQTDDRKKGRERDGAAPAICGTDRSITSSKLVRCIHDPLAIWHGARASRFQNAFLYRAIVGRLP
jgi:hypothetical protein